MSSLASIITSFARVTGSGPKFVGLVYTSKSTGEVARYVLNIGTSYLNLLQKSLAELEAMPAETTLQIEAKAAVKASLEKSIAAHKKGEQSEDYTKKGRYQVLTNGVSQFDDGTCEIRGIIISRKVITPGVRKTVNSKPLTIAKQAYEQALSKSAYVSLCVDAGNLHTVRVGGSEIEVSPMYSTEDAKTAVISVTTAQPASV